MSCQIVLVKIAAMFLVILAGWLSRRRGYLAADTTRVLSLFVVDVAFPALAFTQMLHTVTWPALQAGWFIPLLGALLMFIPYLGGLPLALWFADRKARHTFLFLAAMPNWIFLPLPIVEAVYGDAGVRTIFLYNLGAQLMFLSFGVWILQGGKISRESLRELAINPGLIATIFGIIVALTVPSSRDWEMMMSTQGSRLALVAAAVVQALAMVGSMTIPVSLLAIGAQLGDLELHVHRPSRSLWGVVVARLLIGPALTALIGWLVIRFGVLIPEVPRMEGYLIAAMPVAISCSVFTEQYKGDAALAAQGIFYSTLISLLTVPTILFAIQHLGL